MALPQNEINRIAGDCAIPAMHGQNCENILLSAHVTDRADRDNIKQTMVEISRQAHENPSMKLFPEFSIARDGSLHVYGARLDSSDSPQISDSSSPLNPFRTAYNHYFPTYDREVLK